jgi:uncharacterized protein (TIGR02678 family)
MAALARCRDQLMIDELVGEVRGKIAEAELDVDLDAPSDRRALYAALLALVEFGVLRERDREGGGLERWVSDTRAQSLLDVDRDRLRLLPAASVVDVPTPAVLLDAAALPSAAGGARVVVRRRLLESPVMTTADLTDEQAEWWRRNRNREQERLGELFGVELELRVEGGLMIDAEDELSDITFPGKGTAKQFALLLVERLALWCQEHGAYGPWHRVPADVVVVELDALAGEYRSYLNKAHREAPHTLQADVLGVLTAVGLVRADPDDPAGPAWQVHAAASRYAPQPEIVDSLVSQASLFDDAAEGD